MGLIPPLDELEICPILVVLEQLIRWLFQLPL